MTKIKTAELEELLSQVEALILQADDARTCMKSLTLLFKTMIQDRQPGKFEKGEKEE